MDHWGEFQILLQYSMHLSFTAQELADAISDRVEGFTCDFVPDIRQDYADSWPNSVDREVATKEWGWTPNFDLALLVDSC